MAMHTAHCLSQVLLPLEEGWGRQWQQHIPFQIHPSVQENHKSSLSIASPLSPPALFAVAA
jgi:hypothetical protein